MGEAVQITGANLGTAQQSAIRAAILMVVSHDQLMHRNAEWFVRQPRGMRSCRSPAPVRGQGYRIHRLLVCRTDPAVSAMRRRRCCSYGGASVKCAALNVPLGAVVRGLVRRVARVGRRRAKFSTSVSLICGGWLPQVAGFVAGGRVSRIGRGLVRAAHSSFARASGLRGSAPPHPSGDGLSGRFMRRWRRPRGSRRARARMRR